MSRTIFFRVSMFVLLAGLVAAPSANAGSVSLEWDPSVGATSYSVHYGTSSGNYTGIWPAGSSTTTVVDNLTDCTVWYFGATASNAAGESGFSNETSSMPRPVVSTASPSSADQGTQLDVTLSGVNYQAGTTVQFSNGGITVNSAAVSSCTDIVVNITIGAGATPGPVDVEVTRADGVRGSASGIFTVVAPADTTPPVVSAISAGNVAATSAVISWTTDEPADSQVFFRRVGETSYQQTAIDSNLVTNHSVTLQGLMPDTMYDFHVRSADAAGNSTTSPDDTFMTATSQYSYITIEAESGTLVSPIQATAGAGAFAGEWIDTPAGPTGSPSNPRGTATFGVHLPSSGTWYLWVRMYGASDQSNSWYESVDGGSRGTIGTSTTGVWEWVEGRSNSLNAGLHSVELAGRESEARADRILLTDDPGFVPTEQPGSDTTPPAGVSQLVATAGDSTVQLSWTNPASDYAMTVIRYRTDGQFPAHPADGLPLMEIAGAAGASDSFDHVGLVNGQTYSYGVFVVDAAGNASAAAEAEATPAVIPQAPDPPTNLRVVTN